MGKGKKKNVAGQQSNESPEEATAPETTTVVAEVEGEAEEVHTDEAQPQPEPEPEPSVPITTTVEAVHSTSSNAGAAGSSRGVSPSLLHQHGRSPQVPLVLGDHSAPDGTGRRSDLRFSEYEALNDPMRNMTPYLTGWGKFKMYGLGIFTIPLRVAATVGILSTGAFIGKVAQFGLNHGGRSKKKGGKKGAGASSASASTSSAPAGAKDGAAPHGPIPLTPFRRWLSSGIYTLARVLLFTFGFHYIRVKGKRDPNATVLVCNHMGPFEATAILHFSRATVVSRIENASIPLFGSVLRSLQCIFVNRNSVESRDDTIHQIQERATAKPGVWPQLLIFPEGTTGNGRSIMRFRTGAFIPGVAVQPIVAKFNFKNCDPSWCDQRIGMGPTMFRVMTQIYNSLELHYLPTYHPNEAERADPALYAENVRQYMCKHGGLPASQYSIDDYFVIAEAYKYNIPQSDALLGMEMLRKESNITAMDVKRAIRAFGELDTGKRGRIGYGQFLRYLGMPDTVVTRTIFAEVVASGEKADGKSSQNSSFTLDGGNISTTNAAAPSASAAPTSSTATDSAATNNGNVAVASPTVSEAVYEMVGESGVFSESLSDSPSAKAITFRQFLRAIVTINKNMSTEDKISQAFEIINFTGTGRISKEEMIAMFDFAAVEMSAAQIKDIYGRLDTRRVGYVDKIEFGAFLRANPIYIAMFEAARRYEREKDLHNPVVQALTAKANNAPVTVEQFKAMVAEYRAQRAEALHGEDSIMYF